MLYRWSGLKSGIGYECSSKGDNRFSALYAKMPDGRSIEEWYQCDVKGYDAGGRNWKWGKGKPSLIPYPEGDQYRMYKAIWQLWALQNIPLMIQLRALAKEHDYLLKDMFAQTPINQARALSEILNDWFV